MTKPISLHLRKSKLSNSKKCLKRQELLAERGVAPDLFSLNFSSEAVEKIGSQNCENLVGNVAVPVGVAGPVRIKAAMAGSGALLDEEVMVPLATTEGALVASVNRGCRVLSEVKSGVEVFVKNVGISRAPVFECGSGREALQAEQWFIEHQDDWAQLAEATSGHLTFKSFNTWVRGRYLYVRFVFDTDEAMGMNMVSIAISAAWEQLKVLHEELNEVEMVSLSSNVCTDKKAATINDIMGRGNWVQAEAMISRTIVEKFLHTTPEAFVKTHIAKNLYGSALAGTASQSMQTANVVAAMFLATGQDMAHVVEGSQATLVAEVVKNDLYISVTLPSLVLGTVGGGTWLPAQKQARELIRLGKEINKNQLAAVVGAACLAGELSGIAALASQQLAGAHQDLARSKNGNK